ncbi:L7Ae/L30e/S12e/Gadd45 family ribosomal protein [Alkaliphilus transvaalensis]|uniref:L7Ae/L30e/S12e/Gadd45 family ribosomal protein n=1 Tax=Alkaliphilus transvaalensis TaxID=114628 RepID=UPI002FE6A61C
MSVKDKIKNLIGFAMKAGKLVSGEDGCKIEIKKNNVFLIIVAEDATDNTKKLFTDKTSYRSIPLRFFEKKETLGHIIGKAPRAVIGIKDKSFAEKLIEHIDNVEDSKYLGGD